MKVVINACYGGFSISKKCAELMAKMGDKTAKAELDEWAKKKKHIDRFLKTGKWDKKVLSKSEIDFMEIDAKYHKAPTFHGYGYIGGPASGYERNSATLVAAVEKLGSEKASGECSELKIVEIPDGIDWEISEYDGREWVNEKHQSWS